MLVEFRVVPMGHHQSDAWSDRVRTLLQASGLAFEQGTMSACVEGEWSQVMEVVHRCHQAAFALSPHVLTSITVNEMRKETDEAGQAADSLGTRFPRKGMDAEC